MGWVLPVLGPTQPAENRLASAVCQRAGASGKVQQSIEAVGCQWSRRSFDAPGAHVERMQYQSVYVGISCSWAIWPTLTEPARLCRPAHAAHMHTAWP